MSINFGEPEPEGRGGGFGSPPGLGMPSGPGPVPFSPAAGGPQSSGFPAANNTGFPSAPADQWGDPLGAAGYPQDQYAVPSTSAGKPPLAWLIAAVLAALVAGGLALWSRSLPVILACWVCAGPVAVTLLAQFRSRDQAARAKTTYLGGGWVTGLAITAGVVILVGVALTAFALGRWVAYA